MVEAEEFLLKFWGDVYV